MVQGRLSSEVAGKYQHFPIHNWREEFYEARKLGFDGIEWIISDFSNPIFDKVSQKEIISLVNKTGLEISSISLDLLMPKTLDKFSQEEISWIFENINEISSKVKLSRVSIPIEETCGIRDANTLTNVQNKLIEILNKNSFKGYSLAIETDMSPEVVASFLHHKDLHNIGVLLDVGNSAAYGYKLEHYFNLLSERIFSIHIKDRPVGIGPTVPLGDGSTEFEYLSLNINKLNNLKDITLQTFKTNDNFHDDLKKAKSFIDNKVLKEFFNG
ncbi:uncharacterized protein METZ01_LOCUS119073 [marine metagenome]|uniref:Xylose isomerase-like TIM barrel domain-containing protein n=1 Tax=marine metagenome TaxID=408172 RepID=A0A381XNA2_9ZZZZ